MVYGFHRVFSYTEHAPLCVNISDEAYIPTEFVFHRVFSYIGNAPLRVNIHDDTYISTEFVFVHILHIEKSHTNCYLSARALALTGATHSSIYIYAYICIYIYIFIYIYICIYVYIHMYTYIYIYVYVYIFMILVAFITGNSSLEPLIEGLYAQIHVNLR